MSKISSLRRLPKFGYKCEDCDHLNFIGPTLNSFIDFSNDFVQCGVLIESETFVIRGSAVLVGSRTVLTATHALRGESHKSFSVLFIKYKSVDPKSTELVSVESGKCISHTDISILYLKSDVRLITPMELDKSAFASGINAVAVGFGCTRSVLGIAELNKERRFSAVMVLEYDQSRRKGGLLTKTIGHDWNLCDNDSGGMLVRKLNGKYVLIGVHHLNDNDDETARHSSVQSINQNSII